MAAKYDARTSSDGQCNFNLKAANGKVILTSEGTVALSHREAILESITGRRASPAIPFALFRRLRRGSR